MQEEGRRGRENSRQRKRRSGKDIEEGEEEGQKKEEEEEGTIGRIPGSGALAPQNLGNRKIRLGLCRFQVTGPSWLASIKPETLLNRALNVFLFDIHA